MIIHYLYFQVRQFIENDDNRKRDQNIMVIDYLMDFNPKNIPNEINHLIY